MVNSRFFSPPETLGLQDESKITSILLLGLVNILMKNINYSVVKLIIRNTILVIYRLFSLFLRNLYYERPSKSEIIKVYTLQ